MSSTDLTIHTDARVAQPLESERVIVEAPFSFIGSTKRIMRLNEKHPQETTVTKTLMAVGIASLLVLAWAGVLTWYATFGLFLVPYRLVRRRQRRQAQAELRHREQLAALEQRSS